jgi:hypothetical protein
MVMNAETIFNDHNDLNHPNQTDEWGVLSQFNL